MKARNVGHSSCEACGQEDTGCSIRRIFHLKTKRFDWYCWLSSVTSALSFPMQASSNELFFGRSAKVTSECVNSTAQQIWTHLVWGQLKEQSNNSLDNKNPNTERGFGIMLEPGWVWHGCVSQGSGLSFSRQISEKKKKERKSIVLHEEKHLDILRLWMAEGVTEPRAVEDISQFVEQLSSKTFTLQKRYLTRFSKYCC